VVLPLVIDVLDKERKTVERATVFLYGPWGKRQLVGSSALLKDDVLEFEDFGDNLVDKKARDGKIREIAAIGHGGIRVIRQGQDKPRFYIYSDQGRPSLGAASSPKVHKKARVEPGADNGDASAGAGAAAGAGPRVATGAGKPPAPAPTATTAACSASPAAAGPGPAAAAAAAPQSLSCCTLL
jgi:hypothetical protein